MKKPQVSEEVVDDWEDDEDLEDVVCSPEQEGEEDQRRADKRSPQGAQGSGEDSNRWLWDDANNRAPP
ncbi:unnamed protein product, partial [Mycena citricolor]